MHILLVEDDESLAAGLRQALGREGFVVNHVATGRLALAAVAAEPPDMIVLDLGLPDMDGLDVLSRIREQGARTPVMVLTARGEIDDRIAGLDRGADDYLSKPFGDDQQETRTVTNQLDLAFAHTPGRLDRHVGDASAAAQIRHGNGRGV